MTISKDKEVLYSTVTKEVKNELQRQADKEQRTLSGQAAYILTLWVNGELAIQGNGQS